MKSAIGSALAFLLVALVVLLATGGRGSVQAGHSSNTIATIGIDMDVTGNEPSTRVGVDTTLEACVRVDQGQTREIDVFVDEVPTDRGISGFEFDMLFDPSLAHVTSLSLEQLLEDGAGSSLIPLGDSSSTDGSLRVAAVDFGTLGIDPAGASEVGPGILVRITLTGQSGTGVGDLTLQGITITDDEGIIPIPVDATLNAKVAANTDCPSQPTPTATSTPTPTPTVTSTPTSTPVPPLPTLRGERGSAVLTEVIRLGREKAISGFVTFAIPQPDTSYTAMFVSTDVLCRGQVVTEKTTTGFRAVCGGNFTSVTVDWAAIR